MVYPGDTETHHRRGEITHPSEPRRSYIRRILDQELLGASSRKVKVGNRHTTRKSVSERIQLHIPPGKLQKFSSDRRYGNYETAKAAHKANLTMLSDAEIILAYNAELRGLAEPLRLSTQCQDENEQTPIPLERELVSDPGTQA